MNNDPLELEICLDALIRGELPEPDRQEVLDRVATDETARGLLADMLRCRRLARQAFGYDGIGAKMAEGMAQLSARLIGTSGSGRPRRLRPDTAPVDPTIQSGPAVPEPGHQSAKPEP